MHALYFLYDPIKEKTVFPLCYKLMISKGLGLIFHKNTNT